MEVQSITRDLANEDQALKSLLEAFGSAFSLQDIAFAFSKAGRDTNLASQILRRMRTSLSANKSQATDSWMTHKSAHAFEDKNLSESQHSIGINSRASREKKKPASVGTISNVLGKNYVWRPVQPNGTANVTKPLKLETIVPLDSSDESLSLRGANSSSSEGSSSVRDVKLDDDVENFLFEMLGRGFQLERSAIREVLGKCGYDMKRSVETLIDLTAATLDRRNNLQEGDSNSNFENLSSRNQVRNQTIDESDCDSTTGKLSLNPSRRYEQQKEVLTALFHAPQRSDSTTSSIVPVLVRKSRSANAVVAEPLQDIAEHEAKSTIPQVNYMKGKAEEDEYQVLRKAVKEHHDTMKEYYRAAAEAFASGDHARADLLLEKGQYFYNKAREANEESALKIFETSRGDAEMQEDMSLDLQGHDAKEAIRLLKYHLRSLSGIPSIETMKILIGKGKRDDERRKRLVIKLFEREGIPWTEDENSGTICLRLDEIDPKTLGFARK